MTAVTMDSLADRLRYRRDLGLLFDPASGTFHRLRNTVAKLMVDQIYSGADRQDVLDTVADRYHADPALIAADLDTLVTTLTAPIQQQAHAHGESLLAIDKRFDTRLDFPLRLEIELTAVCNWNCGFCYNVWKIDPTMSDSDIRREVRRLPEKHIPTSTPLGPCSAPGISSSAAVSTPVQS